MQVGAAVYVASQARDFYTTRLGSTTDPAIAQLQARDAHQRAMAYEAEAILTVARMHRDEGLGELVPNEYQAKVLGAFPQGIETPAVQKLIYPTPEFPVGRMQ